MNIIRRNIIRLIGIALLVVILFTVDYQSLFAAVLKVDLWLFLLSFVLVILIYVFKSLRWRLLLYIQGVNYSFKNCFIVFFSSNYIAFITPGRLGEIAKAFYLKKDKDIPLSKALPTVFLDRLFDVYMLIVLGAFGFFKFSMHDSFNIYSIIILALIILAPWFFLVRRISMPLIRVIFKLPLLSRHAGKIITGSEHFFDEINTLINYKLIYGVILTFISYSVLFIIGYILSLACGFTIDFMTIVFFISVANILSFIPISVSGLGTREASFIYLFSLLNMSAESAILYSTLFFITFFIVGGFYGFLLFTIKPLEAKLFSTPRES